MHAEHAIGRFLHGGFTRACRVMAVVIRRSARFELRLKPLKSYAHALCQMLIGWRMQQDLNLFATMSDGTLTIDVLDGICIHDADGELDTYIASEMSSWFRHRLEADNIPVETISVTRVVARVSINTERRRRDTRVHFDWRCRSLITAAGRDFVSELSEPHTWCSGLPPIHSSG
ncbi:hypothetical protein OAG34_00925 [bacterium]|nr:hypothetical protein [bacterium]